MQIRVSLGGQGSAAIMSVVWWRVGHTACFTSHSQKPRENMQTNMLLPNGFRSRVWGGQASFVSRTLRASRPPTNAADPSTRVYPFQPARSMSSVPAFDGLAQLKVCSRTKASRLAAPLVPSHCVPRCLYSLTPVSSADAVSPVTRTLLPDNLPISGQLHARSCARRE